MGSGALRGQRGNSHLIGAVLLVGIVMAGALVVLLGGQAIIDDTQSQGESELAGQTLRQMDGVFQSGPNDENSEVDFPDELEGDFTVNESSDWELQLNGNSDCNSGRRNLGSMEYTDDNDRLLGYEGGGIWKETESGAAMDSPPDMTYRNGSLNLAFPNITGTVTSTRSISATSNASRSAMQDRNLSKALYTRHDYGDDATVSDGDIVCPPSEAEYATLTISDSRFAPAWANYFEDNYDSDRVRVQTSDPDSGDEVRVKFMLGDVSDPEYEVTHVNVTRTADDPVEVEANVTNTGGLEGNQDVTIYFNDSSDNIYASTTSAETIPAGETEKVTLEVLEGDIDTSATSQYFANVTTGDDWSERDVRLDTDDGVPDPEITIDASQNASIEGGATLMTYVDNSAGKMSAVRTVKVYVGGDLIETREFTSHPGDNTSFDTDLPTSTAGEHVVTVETEEDDTVGDSDRYYVGNQPYFEITHVDSPDSVPAASEYPIAADLRNRGHLKGEMEVTIALQKISTEQNKSKASPTVTIAGREHTGSSNTDTVDHSYRFRPADQGRYRYIVDTPNETTTGEFTVGEPTDPNFAIKDVDFSREKAWYGDEVAFNVTVESNGAATDKQRIELVSETGATVWTEMVVLEEGERVTISKTRTVSEGPFQLGFNRITASTNNATADESLYVEEGERIDDDNGSIGVNTRVSAEITVLGAELEGRDTDDDSIRQTPTFMWLDVTNGSTGEEYEIDLFGDRYGGDVNHPEAERVMIQNADPYDPAYTRDNSYKYGVNLSEGSNLSLFAESRSCGYWDWEWTDVVWGDIELSENYYTDAGTKTCGDTGETWIRVSNQTNPANVQILEDGEEVPSYGAAHSYQRGLKDMLGSRITDSGTLSLAPGERVFLYELSKESADPANATGSGDPDYNDAVALFKVTDVHRDVDEPANIVFEDTSDVPAQLSEGEGATFSVVVNNTGGQAGDSNILFDLDGTAPKEVPVEDIEPGEKRTVRFTVPDEMDPGHYGYELDVGTNPDARVTGKLTIDPPNDPHFQISRVEGPSVVDRGDPSTPTVIVTVTNTGRKLGEQAIEFESSDGNERESLQLEPGQEEQVEFDLPTPSSGGYVTYEVSPDDDISTEQRYYVGESVVNVEHVEAGTQTYGENDLVERRELDSLTVKLMNEGSVGDDRTVSLRIEGDGSVPVDETKTVQMGNGQVSDYPNWQTFVFGSPLPEGYYDYTITVEDDGSTEQTWSGEIFVQDDAEVGSSQNSSSPIGVDSNEVVVSGD